MGTISKSGSITTYPSSYDTTDYSYASVSNISNAYTAADSTTYAQINLKTGSKATTYIYLLFDLSSIPANATINSVSCSAKISVSSTSTSYIATKEIQMFTGTTAKGSATSVTSTSATSYTLTCGTWTRAELQNARLRLYAVRGTSSTSTSRYYRFYGATLTVTYTWYKNTYTVTVTNNTSISVTPATQTIEEGESATVQAASKTYASFKDNGTDVTASFVASGSVYKYTLSNLSADHTIVVDYTRRFLYKVGGTWVAATKVYKKVNDSWVEQSLSSYTSIVEAPDPIIDAKMEFPFANESLSENLLLVGEISYSGDSYKRILKGN